MLTDSFVACAECSFLKRWTIQTLDFSQEAQSVVAATNLVCFKAQILMNQGNQGNQGDVELVMTWNAYVADVHECNTRNMVIFTWSCTERPTLQRPQL